MNTTQTQCYTVYLLSLGCAKNLVDSEVITGVLKRDGFLVVEDPAEADVIIINTCGFIEAAKQESIEAILNLAAMKEQGRCRLLLAVGCMPEKYAGEMLAAMPELDAVLGSQKYQQISALLQQRLGIAASPASLSGDAFLLRDIPASAGSAYLKIAEGCSNCCSYCLIPQLRGPYQSRPSADILAEAEQLARRGIQELVLIAQDPTCYGQDRSGEMNLAQLLSEIAKLSVPMIRLLYLYPDTITDELLQVMASHDNISSYLDIPIQHSETTVLAAMNRHSTKQGIRDVVSRIRHYLPDAALRTTVMVGFPGESEAEFEAMLQFLAEAQFDWLGAFPYYQEEDTLAATLPNQIAADVKQQRLDLVMQQAAAITSQRLQRFVGQTLPVLVEEPAEEYGENWYRGRSHYQAPEVDGAVFFQAAQPLQAGAFANVFIRAVEVYDLIGEQA